MADLFVPHSPSEQLTEDVPGVVNVASDSIGDSESEDVLAIVPEPVCAQSLSVEDLQREIAELITRCSIDIRKRVSEWALSNPSCFHGDKVDMDDKKGTGSLPVCAAKTASQPVFNSPIRCANDLKDTVGADPPLHEASMIANAAIRSASHTSSPARRSVGSTTNRPKRVSATSALASIINPPRRISANSAVDRSSTTSTRKKLRGRMSVADVNVKALFDEERNKDTFSGGMTGMLKLPSVEDGPLSKKRQHELEANQTLIQAVTRSRTYELANATLILINAVLIAWESEVIGHQAQRDGYVNDTPGPFFLAMSYVFCCIFVLDLLVRSSAERCLLFTSAERFWNAFDVFVVLTMVLEVVSLSIQVSRYNDFNSIIVKFSMLRIVRLLRIVRVARIVKVVRFFRELRVLVFSILEAISSLLWSVLLMFLLFVMFGVFLNAGAMDYLDLTHGFKDKSNEKLLEFFGTLSHTVRTLFQSISGGIDWGEPHAELQVLSFEYRCCFMAFITFSVFALLNVVTAVFVEGTIERTRKDRDFIMEAEIQSKRDVVEQLYDLFEEIDEDSDGGVTLDEFEKYLQDEAILTYFNALGLDIDTAWSLFLLLDTDETGIVNIEEFVLGCVRLKGGSKKLDVAVLKLEVENLFYSVKGLRSNIVDLKGFLSDEMTILREQLSGTQSLQGRLLS